MPRMKENQTRKTRNYATVVYPESAPENWISILELQLVSCLISPLHNKDVNADGEEKKAHYHVLLMFDGPKTKAQAEEIFSKIGGVGCEVVSSIRGYARYLCHLDNPEKYQYLESDIHSICGADYYSLITLASDKYKTIREMISFCKENNIMFYSDLFDYAVNNREDWFRILCDSGTYVVKEYLKSLNYKNSLNR